MSLMATPTNGSNVAKSKTAARLRTPVSFESAAESAAAGAAHKPHWVPPAPEMAGEYEEREYYDVTSSSRNAIMSENLVYPISFWGDWAAHLASIEKNDGKGALKPFLSSNILSLADKSFTSIVLAFAVTDLPADAPPGNASSFFKLLSNGEAELVAPAPMLVLHKEVRETRIADAGENSGIFVAQAYFDPRSLYEEGVMKNEMLLQQAYGCRVAVTNATMKPQKCALHLQIPNGAIPISIGKMNRRVNIKCVLNSFRTKTELVHLDGFQTYVAEYFFYFPAAGSFGHYPMHVSQIREEGTVVVSYGLPNIITVVSTLTNLPNAKLWDSIAEVRTLCK